jgi:hypothetical protein
MDRVRSDLWPANSRPKLIEAQRIESGCGEQVVGVQVVVAGIVIDSQHGSTADKAMRDSLRNHRDDPLRGKSGSV